MLRSSKRLYSALAKTPLYPCHIELGGKMVDYAGFDMPVLYQGQTHIESHHWVREKCGLFDVSHMLQHRISGPDAKAFLQKCTPIDLDSLAPFQGSLSVLLNEDGGVIDDCIITKHDDDHYYMVTNAGCRDKDMKFLKKEGEAFNSLDHQPFESTLLAIQGPKAAEVLQQFTQEDLTKLFFGNSVFAKVAGIKSNEPVHIARAGYTGEDGFELSIPSSNHDEATDARNFFMSLIEDFPETVKPIGLAARDSLRLEAGMCLYGNELSEDKTPIDASLAWLVPKSRRETGGFNGAAKILSQIKDKSTTHRRVGIRSKGPAPRGDSKIYSQDGNEIGWVTSGSASPTLGGNVGQAYIEKGYKFGTPIKIEIRGKQRDGEIAKLPFIEAKFYRGE
ncbi:hypothetical protein DIURU_004303 [Diutina rugosa]|uniref:Aminomethyltransferase n=1 Tax=Diutina rugosa TaxID=5481 RepID=A0A642UI95_DIURU|nr:uncharacterized protein DIURU_004303 [Diutina rugosa]KAA8899461.1 hypothetical protein DIURU_004303 [Diutina rugosa]